MEIIYKSGQVEFKLFRWRDAIKQYRGDSMGIIIMWQQGKEKRWSIICFNREDLIYSNETINKKITDILPRKYRARQDLKFLIKIMVENLKSYLEENYVAGEI